MNSLNRRLEELKKQRGAVILAHNYVDGAVQDAADFVGDSLELSIRARDAGAAVIVFCGVSFMAETAKVLSPASTVLLPVPDAGCPMADMATAADVAAFRKTHPRHALVAYVNTTAAVKAEVDLCCTSANAEKVLRSIPADQPVMLLPDRNLGANIAARLGRKIELWPGFCPIHNRIPPEMIRAARAAHPGAEVLVHLECPPETVAEADAAMSTGGMLRRARESAGAEFIIGTEAGILHRLRRENPGKQFYALTPEPICRDMKRVTLETVVAALESMQGAVELPGALIERARLPIDRMLAL